MRREGIEEHSYDLVVAGLGTAGAIALVTAARQGLRVLGVERLAGLGGTGTQGAVDGYYFGSRGGLYEETDERVRQSEHLFATLISAKPYALERAAVENGAALLYRTMVTDVRMDGDRVTGLCLLTEDGPREVRCRYVIDATGDGNVCALTGCAYRMGRQLDGKMQPYSRMHVIYQEGRVGSSPNRDFGRLDPTDAGEVSRTLLQSGAAFLREDYAAGDCYDLTLSPMVGIREGRLIDCEENLSFKDFLNGNLSREPLFYSYGDIDRHGWDLAFEDETLCDWAVAANLGALNVTVPVPLGAMLPKRREGLLAVGRCMGLDHNISAGVRLQRDMQKAGEAAATAVSLALGRGVPVRDIPYADLAGALRLTGCLNEENNLGYAFDAPNDPGERTPVTWLEDMDAIREGLSGRRPGVAVWSCRLLGEKAAGHLCGWLGSENPDLEKHSAIALGLLGRGECVDVLSRMVRTRDGVLLEDCRKHNQFRGVIAIYLLGKLRHLEIADELIALITDEAEIQRPLYTRTHKTTRYAVEGYNDTYFQFFSHSVMALIRLGEAFPGKREKIARALRHAVEDERFVERVTAVPGGFEQEMARNICGITARQLKAWGL